MKKVWKNMKIEIQNCNSIISGTIYLRENGFNLKYGINGTGKTSIIKAISATINKNQKSLDMLRPYKYHKNGLKDSFLPKVTGLNNVDSVLIFNDDYLNQFVFSKSLKDSEAIVDSFSILIKPDNYDEMLNEIDNKINAVKKVFDDNPELNDLISKLNAFVDGFGKALSFSRNGKLIKALNFGNKIDSIPSDIQDYSFYIQNSADNANISWVNWMHQGEAFFNAKNECCPYCLDDIPGVKQQKIRRISEIYSPETFENLKIMLDLVKGMRDYLSDETWIEVEKVIYKQTPVNQVDIDYLVEIKKSANLLKIALAKLLDIGYIQFVAEDGRVAEKLHQYKIDLSQYKYFNSKLMNEKILNLNKTLDDVENQAKELDKLVGITRSSMSSNVRKNVQGINEFLKCAGYDYHVEAIGDDGNFSKVIISPNIETEKNYNIKDCLSYGEKNAFALAMFLFDVKNKNPDLIILDDPVSSFDGNKRFAILDMLFLEESKYFPSLKGRTTLFMTHDFEVVIDTVKVFEEKFHTEASFLINHNGELSELPILSGDIKPFIVIVKDVIKSKKNGILKTIYLRRLYEIITVNKTSDSAWNILSNLFHKREINQLILCDGSKMPAKMIEDGINTVKTDFTDFDYCQILKEIKNDNMIISLYKETNSRYEKLQLFRILFADKLPQNEKVFTKYINEVFHVENDYLYQLNPEKYDTVPDFVISHCDELIESYDFV